MSKKPFLITSGLSALLLVFSGASSAFASTDLEGELGLLKKRIEAQQVLLDSQNEEIAKQRELIESLIAARVKNGEPVRNAAKTGKSKTVVKKDKKHKWHQVSFADPSLGEKKMSALSARGAEAGALPPPPSAAEGVARPQVDALANQGGVLSREGVLTFENAIEYTNTTRNLFAFNGVQLAEVVLVGGITASAARHQVVQESGRFRLGITDRLEADVRIPFVYRNDALTNSVSEGGSVTTSIEGANLGDIDFGLAYQMNDGLYGWPFLVGNVRYKTNNADGPFDVPYDDNNIAKRLPTGTGFQTVEASVTAIKVSDPAVLFGNIGYVYNVPRDINHDFNGVYVGNVSPGDAINALVGMGFAINQDLSFSLGYKHSYVFPTYQKITQSGSTTRTSSGTSQVGAVTFGISYAVTPETTVSFNVEAGATNDAPDVRLIFRVPIKLGTLF